MSAPVFLRFAMLRERLDVSVEEAAADLGVASGWLHELEDFVRVADPNFEVRPRRGFATTMLATRLAEIVSAYILRSDYLPVSLPLNAHWIAAMLRADAYFHALMSYLANIFIDFRVGREGYRRFFQVFIRLLCWDRLNPAVIYAPQDSDAAWALDYALRRFWGPTRKKRKSGRDAVGVWYEPADAVEPGQALGVLHGGQDALRKAFWVPPGRKPYFAYLLLYICLKRVAVSFDRYPLDILSLPDWPVEVGELREDVDLSFPAGAALVLNTAAGDVTVFFRTILEPCDEFYVVKGNMLLY